MKEKYKILFKDTMIFALGSFGSKVILFFLVPLYTNYLSTAEYGIADLIFSTAQLIVPVVSLTIHNAVIRFGLMKGVNKSDVLAVSLIVGAFGTLLTVVGSPFFRFYSPINPWKWYLCIYVILSFNLSILNNYLKVKDKNKQFALISIFQTLVMALLNILLLTVFKLGVKGYLLANILAAGLSLLLSIIAGGVIHDLIVAKPDKKLFREMLAYSVPLILNDLSWWVIHSSDKIMVEAIVGASALGLYTVATKIPSLINVMISIFGQAWGLSSIREFETSNDSKFYAKVLEGYAFITCSACIIFITIVKPFMKVYVGASFYEAWAFVPLLLVSAVFSAISAYYGQMYGALKKSVNSMATTFAAAIVNVAVNLWLIPKLGVWGAVIGTLVAYVVVMIARMVDVGRYISINIDFWRFTINCGLILAQGIAVSMNFHVYIVSILSLFVFFLVNMKTIKAVVNIKKNKS